MTKNREILDGVQRIVATRKFSETKVRQRFWMLITKIPHFIFEKSALFLQSCDADDSFVQPSILHLSSCCWVVPSFGFHMSSYRLRRIPCFRGKTTDFFQDSELATTIQEDSIAATATSRNNINIVVIIHRFGFKSCGSILCRGSFLVW